MSQTDLTVYHDGSCPLCRLEIGHYRRQEGADRISFVDVSAPDVDLGPDLTREGAMSRFHIRHPTGELRSGAPAFATIWEALPRWQWAARIARRPGVMSMLDLGYRLFLPLRPTFARIAERFDRR